MPIAQSTTRTWTPQQRAAIESAAGNLLVSAAAGSGKTAVLAERCAELVCNRQKPCSVKDLLVVTFTESAAAEMKSRIQQALRRRYEQNPDPRLAIEVALAEYAHVSTVHGFCRRLLKQHFNLAGIDPEFEILDADEADLLRREIATYLFHRRYEASGNEDFRALITAYGDGDDQQLIEQVQYTHALLASLTDPQAWIDKTLSEIAESAEKPIEESQLGQKLLKQLTEALDALIVRSKEASRLIAGMDKAFAGYVAQLDELTAVYHHWKNVLDSDGLDMLISEIRDFQNPKAPAIRNSTEGKDLAQTLLKSVKEAKVAAPLSDLLAFNSAEWRDGMSRVRPHAEAFLALVEEFGRRYAEAKEAVRGLDFSDLERFTYNILRDPKSDSPKPSPLALALQEQFKHVLVDEYQDINPIQDAILNLVSRASASGPRGNFFCVGDVKQSIFRFRLAEPGRFLERHKRFSEPRNKAGAVIDLRENFRSRAKLLNAINGVFSRLMTAAAAEIDYDDSHRLRPGRDFPTGGECFAGAPIELHLLADDPSATDDSIGDEPSAEARDLEKAEWEATFLAHRIQEIMGKGGKPRMSITRDDGSLAPIEYGDIVILLRSLVYKADQFANVLRAHGIPVYCDAGIGFFTAVEVRDMVALLQLLDNQQQDIPLAAILRSPLAALPNADESLARIRIRFPFGEDRLPFHKAVCRYAAEETDDLAAHLLDVLSRLHEWREQANKRPVAELIQSIYEQTGYVAYVSGLEDGRQRVANLQHLHERAAQFGNFLRQGLYRFLKFIEALSTERDAARPSPANEGEQVVRIMSVHRSKGLEFPVVLLPDLGKVHNLQSTAGSILVDREGGLGMAVVDQDRLIRYPSLASTLIRQSMLHQTLAEELRLLYVAMTRAREHLICVGTCPEKKMDESLTRWTGHAGPLPPDIFQSGRTMLDWLCPVAAMSDSDDSPIFRVERHSPTAMAAWPNPRAGSEKFTPWQGQLARLEPIVPAPSISPEAARVIARFENRYPFEPFTRTSASASVTGLSKHAPASAATQPALPPRKLDLPRFYLQEATPKATDIGLATHAVLEHFDFSSDVTPENLQRQISSLVDGNVISPEQAPLVNRDQILWFLKSEVGRLIRQNHQHLLRELPFALAEPAENAPESSDPLDRVMIRGRIDLMVPQNEGLALVDYKTDHVTLEELPARAAAYAGQMRFYAQAIERVAKRRLTAIYLVFLNPKQIVTVSA
jgi:ATP-dependent helicase/nuclease subunit A